MISPDHILAGFYILVIFAIVIAIILCKPIPKPLNTYRLHVFYIDEEGDTLKNFDTWDIQAKTEIFARREALMRYPRVVVISAYKINPKLTKP